MKLTKLRLAAAVLFCGGTTFAGSFTNDFSDPNNTTGMTFGQVGNLTDGSAWAPIIANKSLALTTNQNGLEATLVLADLDPGATVGDFTVSFNLLLDSGTATPADGFTFEFGNVVPGNTWDEEGPLDMNGITISFDTYDNGGADLAPAIDVKINGGGGVANNYYFHKHMQIGDLMSPSFTNVLIQLKRNGTLSLTYKGQVVFTNLYLNGYTPTAGSLFGFGARTGGLNENCLMSDLKISTTVLGPATIPTITSDPASITVAEGSTANFSVGFDGNAPLTFQWAKNATDIPGATNSTLTLARVHFSDNGAKFKCKVTNSAGSAVSGEGTLTVTPDTTAPTLLSASPSEFLNQVTLAFSEPMLQSTAQNVANYAIPGLTIISAGLFSGDDSKVILVTSPQTQGTSYTLTINNLQDQATTANSIAANTKVTFESYVLLTGICRADFFDNIGGATTVADLTNSVPYQANNPDLIHFFTGLDVSESYLNGNIDNYGVRVSGWIVPPTSGDWDFFIRSDDSSQLFLSTDATAAGLVGPICSENGCCNAFLEPGATQTTASPISLIGGNKYYFVALMKEGGGGDFVQVAMRKTTDTTAAGSLKPISGTSLVSAANPLGSTISIDQQPAPVTGVDGKTVSFSVVATGNSALGSAVIYQWQKNGQDISGANQSTYTFQVALADNAAQFTCVVSVPGKSLTSNPATLTVIADTFPPVVVGAGALKNPAGSFDVGVAFDEAIDPAAATNKANYTLSAGTLSTVNIMTNSQGVILTVAGLTAGNKYTVSVKNVADLKSNAMPGTNVDFVVSGMSWGTVGAEELPTTSTVGFVGGFPNGYGVLPVATNGFDIYSDGVGEWGNFDETTFVYEQVTGDFDKKLRVEYQDASSQWARAGLIMREDLSNFGQNRDTQATTAGRYQKIHVNPSVPTLTGPGTVGNNAWEGNRRLDVGGQSSTALTANNSTPLYPNAWVRLQRVGQTFNIFRSDDGKGWIFMGFTTWPDAADPNGPTPLTNTVYVGPEYTPEDGNITQDADRGRFLAKIRDYGDTWGPVPQVAKRDYSVGLNFGADRNPNGVPTSLAPTDLAGVPGIKQKNWNNLNGAAGTNNNLVADQNGTAVNTTIEVVYASSGTWSTQGDGETNNIFTGADAKLMNAYIDSGDATTSTVTIQNITPALTSNGYDVYVYAMASVGTRGGGFRVLDASSGTVLKDYVYARATWDAPDYYPVPANTTTNDYGVGNYIVFSGLTAPAIKIEATTANGLGVFGRGLGAPRASVNAVQLVAPSAGAVPTNPTLSIQKTQTGVTLTYQGTLQSADAVNGTWSNVQGAVSPYPVTVTTGQKFYRAK